MCFVDASVYAAADWCAWDDIVMESILNNTNITKPTEIGISTINALKILPD
jgi:hypothetical protein